MNCRAARRMMSAYLDGELPEIEAGRLNEHMGLCSACRAEMSALRSINGALDAWPGIAPTFSLADIKQRAALHRPSRTWNPLRIGQVPRWATAALAAFAIAVGTVGGVGLGDIRQPAPQSMSASAAVSDILSLGGFGDPLVDLVSAEIPTVQEID